MEWQPIESAPKDGMPFLAYFGNGEQHVVDIAGDGECRRPMDEAAWELPTHWMPLPEPPEKTP
jgi:hypothetical protein